MWGDINTEPKRTNRFLTLGNLPIFTIQQVTLPQATIGEAKVDYVSHVFKYPGKLTWGPVSMTLVDAVVGNETTSNIIMDIIKSAGYEFPTSSAPFTGYSPPVGDSYVRSFTKFKFNQAVGEIGIQSIDAEGNPIDQWMLKNSWIQNIQPGELNMANAEIVNIKLAFVYDWAEYKKLP